HGDIGYGLFIGAPVELPNLPVCNWPKRRSQLSFHTFRDGCIVDRNPGALAAAEECEHADRDRRNNNSGGLAAKSFAHDHSINPPHGTITCARRSPAPGPTEPITAFSSFLPANRNDKRGSPLRPTSAFGR